MNYIRFKLAETKNHIITNKLKYKRNQKNWNSHKTKLELYNFEIHQKPAGLGGLVYIYIYIWHICQSVGVVTGDIGIFWSVWMRPASRIPLVPEEAN